VIFFRNLYQIFFSKKTPFNQYLNQILGFYPRNLVFYKLAFQHKSKSKESNERLEFLGDTILDTVISKELYFRFPNKNEGELSKLRSKVVNRSFLNHIGKLLVLEKYLNFQLNSISIDKTNIRGNTLEALIGAIYLDGGIVLVEKFLQDKIFKNHINWNEIDQKVLDFKSKLIQYSQKYSVPLEYGLIREEQTNQKNTEFEIQVILDGNVLAKAKGSSKKKAEQLASKLALETL
tara:strand:+ start:181 stop:882 length:702 start_codon:yes stop_codon:yes gene_type:complete